MTLIGTWPGVELSLNPGIPPATTNSYQTGGYIASSPAVTGNDLLVASTDARLYDFAVGGSK